MIHGGPPRVGAHLEDASIGLFRLGPIYSFWRGVRVRAAGYAPATLSLPPPEGIAQARLTLAATLRGRVVGTWSRGDTITVYAVGPEYRTATCDGEGGFVFTLPPGRFALYVRHKDRYATRIGILLTAGATTEAELTLEPAVRVRGIVIDRLGEPVARSMLYLEDSDGLALGVQTDASGRFDLLVRPGPVLLLRLPQLGSRLRHARFEARDGDVEREWAVDREADAVDWEAPPRLAGATLYREVVLLGLGRRAIRVGRVPREDPLRMRLVPGRYISRRESGEDETVTVTR